MAVILKLKIILPCLHVFKELHKFTIEVNCPGNGFTRKLGTHSLVENFLSYTRAQSNDLIGSFL